MTEPGRLPLPPDTERKTGRKNGEAPVIKNPLR